MQVEAAARIERDVSTAGAQEAPAAGGDDDDPSSPRRADVRAVLLLDVANPFLASRNDFLAHALSDSVTGTERDAPLEAWAAGQEEAAGLRAPSDLEDAAGAAAAA